MKIGNHIYYYPKRKRQRFVFDAMVQGKRICRAFSKRVDAEKFAKEFAVRRIEQGTSAIFFDAKDKELLRQIREVCGEFDPLEAVKFWKRHFDKNAVAPSIGECWLEFLSWLEKSGRSEKYISNMKSVSKQFLAQFHADRLEAIRKDALLAWILSQKNLSPRSMHNLWSNTRNFLSWCMTAKNWLLSVPQIDDRLLPRLSKKPVEVWNVKEFEAKLRWIEQNAVDFLPHFALRAFAGLRTSEASQMQWQWIDFERKQIRVPASICKTRDDWLLLPDFLPETVFVWLKPFRRKNGLIGVPSKDRVALIARQLQWKPNVLRHTFATMHVAFFHDEAKTILATRHTSIATLRANYRGVNQPHKDAVKFFALRAQKTPHARNAHEGTR